MFTYPVTTADNKYALVARRGDFWTNVGGNVEFVADILRARALEELQAQQNFQELVGLLSHHTNPIYHTDLFYALTITESQLELTTARYGDGHSYNSQIKYGISIANTDRRLAIPADLVDCAAIIDSPINETRLLVPAIDFIFSDQLLLLAENPFETGFPYEVLESGEKQITLWLVNARFDNRYLYLTHGYLLGLEQKSSVNYKKLINSVLDCYTHGSSHELVNAVLANIIGTPLVQNDSETVEAITNDAHGQVIITDKAVYRGPAAATAVVAVSEVVVKGQTLFDAITWCDLATGEIPAVDLLQLDKELLPAHYLGGLAFPNRAVPIEVVGTVSGKTKIKFEITGHPNDVEAFFDELHTRAIVNEQLTLAELLDVRGPTASTQPSAASLPATINPCEFLVSNVLRFNFMFAKIKLASAENGLDFSTAAILRKIINPWNCLLLAIDLPSFTETVEPDNCTERLELYSAAETLNLTIDPGSVTNRLRLHYLESLC